jgi:hypothetical protein
MHRSKNHPKDDDLEKDAHKCTNFDCQNQWKES